MARRIIDIGIVGNDGTGDSIRDSFRKVNENFRELYSSLGLGERLKFINLDDTPLSYTGQENAIVAVNSLEDSLVFKRIIPGIGITIDNTTDNRIVIASEFTSIVRDTDPRLGGDLKASSGAEQYRILQLPPYIPDFLNRGLEISSLGGPTDPREAISKAYADSKLSIYGVNALDPADPAAGPKREFGEMQGPLILARNPEPEDDERYEGLIAATKAYVDTGGFSSRVNLFVATSGQDERPGISREIQGRSLATAYRTLEAALKRAEELVLESRLDIGPYKKVLTYNGGAEFCSLTSIIPSPDSGTGFAGFPVMRVDTITVNLAGTLYRPNDVIEIQGGTGAKATIRVLETLGTLGGIRRFRIESSGLYTVLPGSTSVGSSATGTGTGTGATFNITYKVNNVVITDKGGSLSNPSFVDYGLVSVRVIGGGGTGSFGTANVVNGQIDSITINDPGSGFTSIPSVEVNLPRFLINTGGFTTDATGNLADTPVAFRTRDLREGLFLKGETSGALAIILAHEGNLDSAGNEEFDVDIVFGSFQTGERISYGDSTKLIQISVLVESGIYEENYPLKIPQNVAIIGDEFRRVIVKPRSGMSSSPWAFNNFRRDRALGVQQGSQFFFDSETNQFVEEQIEGDRLNITDRLFGYHYLTDSSQPVYPKISNAGKYNSTAALIGLNRSWLQEETIAWINYQISQGISPFDEAFEYNQDLCKRDVGLIIDSINFDLRYGGYNRTISAALKYYQNASGLIAINEQKDETVAAIEHLRDLILDVITNTAVDPTFYEGNFRQVRDLAFSAEAGSSGVINTLFFALIDVMTDPTSTAYNAPKNNDEMDVFLCNDANILRAMTMQGHGGFSMVLDPEGQILAKSPYAQECASFSKSINAQTFAGGMFVDGFTGNLQFLHTATLDPFRIIVGGLERAPNTPVSFIVRDTVYRANYFRDFVYNPAGSTCTLVLDETTPFTIAPGAKNCTVVIGTANVAVFTSSNHGLEEGAIIKFSTTGVLPAGITVNTEYYVLGVGITANTFTVTADPSTTTGVTITTTGSGTLSFTRIYELLMPGNRSMLSNDFTQICDLGYGLIATNGGLTEAVSMFTYYCHISYYSINGGQIRSIGGSSAHGNYALVAEGSDPLEIPTPVTLYRELAQKVICRADSGYENITGDLFIFVTDYDYLPWGDSEIEVFFSNDLFRYPITSVTSDGLPAGTVRLNLGVQDGDGLEAAIPDGTKLTWRTASKVVLTGNVVDVAVRPSTGLKLVESPNLVYRVLQFSNYTDENGPYEVDFTVADPAVFNVLQTITDIGYEPDGTTPAANVVTTAKNHRLQRGDKFIPKTTANGLTAGTTYYVKDIPYYNQFILSTDINLTTTASLSDGNGLSIKGVVSHRLELNNRMTFISSGTLPPGITTSSTTYYVIEPGLTDTAFGVSNVLNGTAIEITGAGTGTLSYLPSGLAITTLRENYDYIDITVFQPGEYASGSQSCTISAPADPAIITCVNHGFNSNDVVKFTVNTGDTLPAGISLQRHYFVSTTPTPDTFTISSIIGGSNVATIASGIGSSIRVGLVTGRAGDTQFGVVAVSPADRVRTPDSKFVFKGEQYQIIDYEFEFGESFARVTLDRPLVDSIQFLNNPYTIKSAVTTLSQGASGTLTIRISLTRVTSHDLLEIGTGSYADTNYPNEIYGAPVNAPNAAKEVQERDVGRTFYVTTDQFGNFRVGPYFAVDQGTGRVTFSAAIALSNLDGIGFKRGVPISEFSIDSSFSDNAIDTVPTENAARTYIERRLGTTHGGAAVEPGQLIPLAGGGFMALNGLLPMKANMNLGEFKIIELGDPTLAEDAVNLRSLTFDNFQDVKYTGTSSGQVKSFIGAGRGSINTTITGDIASTVVYTIASTLTGSYTGSSVNSGILGATQAEVDNGIVLSTTSGFPSSGSIKIGNEVFTYTGISSFPVANRLTGVERAKLGSSSSAHSAGAVVSNLKDANLDIQINAGVIVNADVNASADIAQSKLLMNLANTRASAPTGTAAEKQALSGLASFNSAGFSITDGFVSLRDNGTTLAKIQTVDGLRVIGNSTLNPGNVSQVPFSTVVDLGEGVKKSQYSTVGFLRRRNTINNLDTAFEVIEMSDTWNPPTDNLKLIQRSSEGNFAANKANLRQVLIDSNLVLEVKTEGTGGYVALYPWTDSPVESLPEGGIILQNGSVPNDKKNVYRNNNHEFRDKTGNFFAPIRVSQLTVTSITHPDGNSGLGEISGYWSLTAGSRLQATYSADLAENYEGDKEYEVGTVLVFGGDKEVTVSDIENDTRVAGVVSNNAAYTMYEACPGFKNLVALQGRVPCKVIGKIKKGDILVTSGIPGVAKPAGEHVKVGTVVGKALTDYDEEGVGTIEIAVGRT
jgi:hypothetical protein